MALGNRVILIILTLPIQEHGIAFYLFVSSLIDFISILLTSAYRSFVSLGRFIPKYFILFGVMVNGIVSLISLSDPSLLAYRNAVYFYVLINLFFFGFCLLRAAPVAYGGSQARGLMGAVAAGLRQRHSNARSESRL